MDQEPDLRDLQRYVMPHVESCWEDLCIELKFDRSGETLDAISSKWGENPKASCREVLKHWAKGEGEGPHTWGKMVNSLTAIGALEAVRSIREHLSTVSCVAGVPFSSSGNMQSSISMLPEGMSSAKVCSERSEQISQDLQSSENKKAKESTPIDITQVCSPPLVSTKTDSNASIATETMDLGTDLNRQGGGAIQKQTSEMTRCINYSVVKQPRPYQLELASPGMQGKNYIVCAPTGTGKTLVGALIIANHLNQKQGKGKVVFVVPTQPLAKQQQGSIQESIPLARVACCVGDDTGGNIRIAIRDNEVVVCTAGKLWDEIQADLKFTHFSLMVIDECHNARKSSPQARIMTQYLKEKLNEGNVSLPQVLGLTASPGAGDSKVPRLSTTYDHLISLCALMDATEGIVNVKEHKDELEKHTKKSTSILQHYPGRSTDETFIQEVLKVTKLWEREIDLNVAYKPWEQRYTTEVQKSKKELEISHIPLREKFSVLEYLLCLSGVLSTYMQLRHEDAVDILDNFVMQSNSGTDDITEHRIVVSLNDLKKTLGSLDPVPNPLMEKLKDALVSRFAESPNSRAIVFASTKKQASCICDWISKLAPELCFKPRVVVGHTAETGPGMTDSEKEETLAGFREGKYNILVATSVLEEGIDVPSCNLVIRYEHVTNEIAKVQAAGRARAENSEGITIVSNTSNKKFKELLNEEKDQFVKLTMEYLPSGDDLTKQIKQLQERIVNKHEMKRWLGEEKQQSNSQHGREKFLLKCKKCKMEVCHGNELYALQLGGNDISVLNKTFMEEKAKKKPHPRPRNGKEVFSSAKEKIHCKDCDVDWGVVGIWNSREFPILKCKSFNFEREGIPVMVSKWSLAPFKIPPAIFANPDLQSSDDDENDE